jgi:hypothetical protein
MSDPQVVMPITVVHNLPPGRSRCLHGEQVTHLPGSRYAERDLGPAIRCRPDDGVARADARPPAKDVRGDREYLLAGIQSWALPYTT